MIEVIMIITINFPRREGATDSVYRLTVSRLEEHN